MDRDYGVSIPEIEIARDWYVSDLQTLKECEDALDCLTEAIGSIEAQLVQDDGSRGPGWRGSVMKSLRFKKRALEAVTRKRASLASAERRALAWLKKHDPEALARAMEAVSG